MFVFVIALKSPKISASWQLVSSLFERSIKSICNQTCQDFQIVVVCNERPKIEYSNPQIHYIEVDLPVPAQDTFSKELDKASKLSTGLAYAEKFSPSHVMVVDADDCINKNIVDFVVKNPQCQGWYAKKGYVYKEEDKFVYLRGNAFSSLCGSGLIIKYSLHSQLFKNGIYDHKVTRLENNIALQPLPFPGAIYITQTGENLYLNSSRYSELRSKLKSKGYIYFLRDLLQYRLLTKQIRSRFGLFNLKF